MSTKSTVWFEEVFVLLGVATVLLMTGTVLVVFVLLEDTVGPVELVLFEGTVVFDWLEGWVWLVLFKTFGVVVFVVLTGLLVLLVAGSEWFEGTEEFVWLSTEAVAFLLLVGSDWFEGNVEFDWLVGRVWLVFFVSFVLLEGLFVVLLVAGNELLEGDEAFDWLLAGFGNFLSVDGCVALLWLV